jgi:hypothetical protein
MEKCFSSNSLYGVSSLVCFPLFAGVGRLLIELMLCLTRIGSSFFLQSRTKNQVTLYHAMTQCKGSFNLH